MELKNKRRFRPPKGETYTRDGRWVREFNARMEVWPTIEHWAAEHNYHLVATRNNRRVYVKDSVFDKVHTIVDIKTNESKHLTLTVGIQLDTLLRLFTLFFYPKELVIYPKGWRGVRMRRLACRELNVLLTRFGKNPIIGSERFHVADLDATSLILATLFVIPFIAFFGFTLAKLQLFPGLSPTLLLEMGKYLGVLSGSAVALLGAHHYLSLKKLPTLLLRSASAAGAFVIFALLATLLTTKTGRAMTESKFIFHCVYSFNETQCKDTVSKLSAKDRESINSRLQFIEKSLSIKK